MSLIKSNNKPDYRCRVCLSASKTNLDFERNLNTYANVTVLEAIETVMNSKILKTKNTPNKICSMCLSIVEISYNFKNKFEETELNLIEEPSKLSEGLDGSQSELSKVSVVKTNGNPSGIKYNNNINKSVKLKTTPQAQGNDLISYLELSNKRSREDEPSSSTKHSSEPNKKPNMTSPNKQGMYETIIIHVADKEEEENKPASIVCKYCTYKTDNLPNLKRHHTMKHLQTVHQCALCDYCARTETQLKRHANNYHLNEKQSCEFCNFTAETLDDIEKHIDEVHYTKV